MTSYAVIGASKGIGLEYVRQLAKRPDATVLAIVRNAAASTYLTTAIEGLKNVHVLEADVTDYPSLEAAAKSASSITGGTLDCLIHNAARMDMRTMHNGFNHFKSMEDLDADLIDAYKVNALGVVHGVSAFLPLLRASPAPLKKIVVVSTGGADPKVVLKVGQADMLAYSVTKAAALMITTKWGLKLANEGFAVVSMSPGLVDTSATMGPIGERSRQAKLAGAAEFQRRGIPIQLESVEESVSGQLKVIDELKASDNGRFLSHRGGEVAI